MPAPIDEEKSYPSDDGEMSETQGFLFLMVQAATSGRDGSLIDRARSNLSQ
jgi:hypothetical protein